MVTTRAKQRKPAGLTRTASEGGVIAAAAVVAADLAATQFPEVAGAGVLAAAVVGAGGAWVTSVARNLGAQAGIHPTVRALLGVK